LPYLGIDLLLGRFQAMQTGYEAMSIAGLFPGILSII
jgi:hypothetical protein